MGTPTMKVQVDIFEHTCQRCGMVWRSQNEAPRVCTRCKSYLWEIAKGATPAKG